MEDRGDGAGAIVLLFALAVLVGLGVGFGALRYAADPGRPLALHHSNSPPKQVIEAGYHNEADFNADRARERAVLTKLLAGPVGAQALWENPETGNRGVIWVASEQKGAEICRNLVRHTLLNNTYRNSAATICHAPGQDFPADIPWHVE